MRDRLWLLDTASLNDLKEHAFRRNSLLHFGELQQLIDRIEWDVLERKLAEVQEQYRDFWLDSLAEEYLLASAVGRVKQNDIWPRLLDRKVFESCPLFLSRIIGSQIAISLFPRSSDDSAELNHLWLIRCDQGSYGDDHRQILENGPEVIREDVRVYVRASCQGALKIIEGSSWQLSYHLALRALDQEDATARDRLATKWMATGRVESGEVRRVGMMKKASLTGSRRLLFPSENNSDPAMPSGPWFIAIPDVNAAWCHILGSGVRNMGNSPWPESPIVLHTFSSSAVGPVIASVLLSRVERVVIWHTDNEDFSKKPADALRDILLKRIAPRVEVEPLRTISSKDLQQAESQLREALESDLATRKPVIFNITQGNRLMALAPHSLARERENLWLVYRDQQAKGLEFTAIKFDSNGLAETLTLQGDPKVAHVNWQELLRPQSVPAEKDWQRELEKILSISSYSENKVSQPGATAHPAVDYTETTSSKTRYSSQKNTGATE